MLRESVYLDTNVFDHLYKKLGISDADVEILFSAVAQQRVSILLSVLNIEETLCALESDRTLAVRQIRYVLALSDWHRLLKPPGLLLSDAITAYANGKLPREPFIDDPGLFRALGALRNPQEEDIAELLEVVRETLKQIGDFRVAMNEARDSVRPVGARLEGARPSFEDYWKLLAESFAEGLADRIGVGDLCRQRGMAGLLEVRSVRLSVGGMLSLAYAHTFEGRAPEQGDSRDLQHLVGAAAADIFVTHDRKLARLVSRIPIESFRVLTLTEFLHDIE
jgi:hypothetical protein